MAYAAGDQWSVAGLPDPALFVLVLLLVVQAITATSFGLMSGRATTGWRQEEAQVLVNAQLNPVLNKERSCQLFLTIFFDTGGTSMFSVYFRDAVADQLGEFRPDSDRYYHELGPPSLPSACRPGVGDGETWLLESRRRPTLRLAR